MLQVFVEQEYIVCLWYKDMEKNHGISATYRCPVRIVFIYVLLFVHSFVCF